MPRTQNKLRFFSLIQGALSPVVAPVPASDIWDEGAATGEGLSSVRSSGTKREKKQVLVLGLGKGDMRDNIYSAC